MIARVTRADRGMALPLVLIFFMLVLPLVFTLSYRSHTNLKWLATYEREVRARLMAEEGESEAGAELLAGSLSVAGSRPRADGGIEYRAIPAGTNVLGDPIYFVLGEGIHTGQERMVTQFVEVLTNGTARTLLGHDRGWVPSGPSGGGPANPAALRSELEARVDAYVDVLIREKQISLTQFENRMKTQSELLDCPDILARWAELEVELGRAKVP